MNLVSTDWLDQNLNKVKIFDASWHMPTSKRNSKKEYKQKHIKGAIFWDVDEHSDKDSPYPHMMSNSVYWTRMLWSFAVKNEDLFVYDDAKFRIAVLLPFMFDGIENNFFIKICCVSDQSLHFSYIPDIPITDVLIESPGIRKHFRHICGTACIPIPNILIESFFTFK